MQSIVTLTMNPTIDKSASCDRVVPERKLRCSTPSFEPGGGGINVSRVIHRLGGSSLALHLVGGAIGDMLQALLDSEGISQQAIPIAGMTRENFSVQEESTGLQYRFGMPGPTLLSEEWQRSLDALAAIKPRPDYIVASGSLPPGVPSDFYARVARLARKQGSRMVLDTSGDALREGVREGVYLLKPNARELAQLSGHEIEEEPWQAQAAETLIRSGRAETIVVSLGAGGALLVSAEGVERISAPVVPIKSKVGAGDSMVAGIVLSLARGRTPHEAALFGVATGAAAVMTPGSELARRGDAERLYRQLATRTTSH